MIEYLKIKKEEFEQSRKIKEASNFIGIVVKDEKAFITASDVPIIDVTSFTMKEVIDAVYKMVNNYIENM